MSIKNLLTRTLPLGLAASVAFTYLPIAEPAQAAARPSNARPHLKQERVKCSQHFCAHWSPKDHKKVWKRDRNHNHVPDAVDAVLQSSEKSWKVLIKRDGFLAPPSDRVLKHHGPNGKIDVYFTKPSNPVGAADAVLESSPKLKNRRTGFIELGLPLTDFSVGGGIVHGNNVVAWSGRQDLELVVAHEFFHLIQGGYGATLRTNWEVESSAMWAEGQVVPKFGTLDAWAWLSNGGNPHTSPSTPDWQSVKEGKAYAESTLFALITKEYGRASVRHILEDGGVYQWAQKQEGGWARLLADYALANLDPAANYTLGKWIPQVKATTPSFNSPGADSLVGDSIALPALASKTYQWQGTGEAQQFILQATPAKNSTSTPAEWPVVITYRNADGSFTRTWTTLRVTGDQRVFNVIASKTQTIQVTVVDPDAESTGGQSEPGLRSFFGTDIPTASAAQ